MNASRVKTNFGSVKLEIWNPILTSRLCDPGSSVYVCAPGSSVGLYIYICIFTFTFRLKCAFEFGLMCAFLFGCYMYARGGGAMLLINTYSPCANIHTCVTCAWCLSGRRPGHHDYHCQLPPRILVLSLPAEI
jgi:hypothetical protein